MTDDESRLREVCQDRTQDDGLMSVLHKLGAALFAIAATPALACGTVEDWTTAYLDPASTDNRRVSALQELAGQCGNYRGREHDLVLLNVLNDALTRRYDVALIRGIVEEFRCFPASSGDSATKALLERIGPAKCPKADALERMRRITGDGVAVRVTASGGAIVVRLPQGTIVEEVERRWDRVRVRAWTGEKGWIAEQFAEPLIGSEQSQ
jgi:hypothetical protein